MKMVGLLASLQLQEHLNVLVLQVLGAAIALGTADIATPAAQCPDENDSQALEDDHVEIPSTMLKVVLKEDPNHT